MQYDNKQSLSGRIKSLEFQKRLYSPFASGYERELYETERKIYICKNRLNKQLYFE